MNYMNSILLEGNVVRDPVVKELGTGRIGCFFSIATNRYFIRNSENEVETSFFEVETWGDLAEECRKLCTRGKMMRVIGRLKQDRWVDAEGKTKTRIKIVAEHIIAKEGRKKTFEENAESAEAEKEFEQQLEAVAF